MKIRFSNIKPKIDFGMFGDPAPNKFHAKIREREAVSEVMKAVYMWEYKNFLDDVTT